jgi:hypothetical protein
VDALLFRSSGEGFQEQSAFGVKGGYI